MNANETLDYRPQLEMTKVVNAPALDQEVYENPYPKSSMPYVVFKRNPPSVFLEDTVFMEETIEVQKESLLEDSAVSAMETISPSLYRQTLYASINEIDGNTNIILYDRLNKIEEELSSKRDLFVKAYFGDVDLREVKEREARLLQEIGVLESQDQTEKMDYRIFSIDLRAFRIMERYLNMLTEETAVMMESNEPLEKNIYKPDMGVAPLYDLRHDKAIKDILEGKHSMDVGFRNDNVGNKLKRLYNLRTRLFLLTKDLTEEQKKEHEEQLRFAEEEIYLELLESEKDLHKAVESQASGLAKFNQGFKNKCEILYSLKGGNRI